MEVSRCLRLGILACLLISSVGCMQRRLTIHSNPSGALVYIDDYPIGTTPVATSFTYYGTRKVRLVKDGYETLTVNQPIHPPWFQHVPLDFVSDNFAGGNIRDERIIQFDLKPQVMVSQQQLHARAEGLRQNTLVSMPAPVLPSTPQAMPPLTQQAPQSGAPVQLPLQPSSPFQAPVIQPPTFVPPPNQIPTPTGEVILPQGIVPNTGAPVLPQQQPMFQQPSGAIGGQIPQGQAPQQFSTPQFTTPQFSTPQLPSGSGSSIQPNNSLNIFPPPGATPPGTEFPGSRPGGLYQYP